MDKIDWEKLTFRCSSLGKIMVDPQEKSNLTKYTEALDSYGTKMYEYETTKNKETKTAIKLLNKCTELSDYIDFLKPIKDEVNLSETCKTHLSDIRTAMRYGRYEDIKSKYMYKGKHLEEDAITKYCLSTGMYYEKNKERKDNGWINGECDVEEELAVTDTKVNWSIFQFGRVVSKPINIIYKWQLKGYCWLWNKQLGKLVYVLLDTPESQIKQEENRLMYELFGNAQQLEMAEEEQKQMYRDACAEIRRNHTYSDIPDEEKIRIFKIDKTEEDELAIKKRVEECRKYLYTIDKIN